MTAELELTTDNLFRIGRVTGRFFLGNFMDDLNKGFADWEGKSFSGKMWDIVKFNMGSGWPFLYNLYYKINQYYDALPGPIAPIMRTAKDIIHEILHHPITEFGKYSIDLDSRFFWPWADMLQRANPDMFHSIEAAAGNFTIQTYNLNGINDLARPFLILLPLGYFLIDQGIRRQNKYILGIGISCAIELMNNLASNSLLATTDIYRMISFTDLPIEKIPHVLIYAGLIFGLDKLHGVLSKGYQAVSRAIFPYENWENNHNIR